ncbi:MAG: Na+/H+ antiporter subunit E [Microbacteriaceae bacterium]
MTNRETRTRVRWAILQQLPLVVALVVLWMMLWGAVNPLNFVTGVVLALAVTRFLYLPPVELSGRFNLWWFLVFVAQFLGELVVGSSQVAVQAFAPRGGRNNAVISAQLRTRSDFILTLTAITMSLIPGSVVIEVDRENSILYLHVLGAHGRDIVEPSKAKVFEVEKRIVRALGSRADLARCVQ